MRALWRLRSDPLGLFGEAAASGEDAVVYRVAHRQVVLIIGPEPLARVTLTNRANYRKGVSYDALRVPLADSLLTIDGDEATERRRLVGPVFTRRSVEAHVPVIVDAVEDCFRRWDQFADTGTTVDLVAEMDRLAFDVVGRLLLGTELGPAMTKLASLIDGASDWVARRTRALLPLPLGVPTPRNLAFRRDEAGIRVFIEGLIADCRQRHSGEDILSLLVSAHDSGGSSNGRALADEVAGFLMAGHQTTAAALAWTWDLLARHPEIEARMRAEVDAAPALDASDALEHLRYVDQVLHESMRLFPPGWAFTRTPIEADELAGRRIPAGAVVVICSYANQRSPRFWRNPQVFDPERFAPSAPAPESHRYFPFGIGPRACIGRHVALIEAMIVLAMLAKRYRLHRSSDAPVAAVPGITLRPAAAMATRIERR